jgi:sialate O-acetylesterase
MAFLLENAFNGSELVADADNHPLIRLFTSKKLSTKTPQLEQPLVEEPWIVSSRKSVTDDGCPHCNTSTTTNWGSGLGDDNWLCEFRPFRMCNIRGLPSPHIGKPTTLFLTVASLLRRYMSAVCYLYGREVQARTNMPVGLVNTNWGGTPVEFWSSSDSLDKCAGNKAESGGAYNGMITPLLNMTIYGAIWFVTRPNPICLTV